MNTPSPAWQKCINCSLAHMLLWEEYRDHIRIARKELGFEYLRFHAILSDYMRVVSRDEKGVVHYNFQLIDKLYDFILQAGMKPFVELSFMPEALASSDTVIMTWKLNVSPPASYDEWADLIRAVVKHWVERYGIEEVRTWPFEVWNEPDLVPAFFGGTKDEYLKLYAVTVRAIKEIDPAIQVGGPSTSRGKWIKSFLEFCRDEDVPVDFITTHLYPTDGNHFLTDEDEDSWQRDFVGPDFFIDVVRKVHGFIKASHKPELPLIWAEWNSASSANTAGDHRDTPNQAAFMLRTIQQASEYVEGFVYWALSDIYDEGAYPAGAFEGLYGILSQHGLKKSSFFAFQLLHMLDLKSARPISSDGNHCGGWRNGQGDTEEKVLLYHFREFEGTAEAEPRTLTFRFEGKSHVDIYRIDDRNHDIRRQWREMGAPQYPTAGQIRQLKKTNDLRVSETVKLSSPEVSVAVEPETVVLLCACP